MKERKRKQKIKKYAAAFLEGVKEKYPQLSNVQLPFFVLCRKFLRVLTDDGHTFTAAGWTDETGTRIEIYGIARQRPDELKRTIRHEMLHAILAQKSKPNKDDDALFLLLAIEFDAQPYSLFGEPWELN